METRTVILRPKQTKTYNYIPGELVQLLLEWKVESRSVIYSEIVWQGESVTRVRGKFRTIDCSFEVRTSSSHYLEQLEMLLDQNRQFEYEGTR